MKVLRFAVLLAFALAIPASLSAQFPIQDPAPGTMGYLDYQGYKHPSHTYDNFIMNNGYKGALGGYQFDMFCIDPHNSPMDGNVYITKLADAGSMYTYQSNFTNYQKAAWLVSQFGSADPNSHTNGAIQGAIWKLAGAVPSGYTPPAGSIDMWIAKADAFVAANQGWGVNAFAILSDTDHLQDADTYGQEFMVQLPEPGSVLLLLSGLVGIAGVVVRRRIL